MTLCDIILKDHVAIDFGIITYQVIPLTKDSGMIEIVSESETIYSILQRKKTIHQYIMEKNEDKKIKEILDRYMYSLVSYTLHSYLIGLGDRHLENIMIKEDGAIFHIDFSFILGKEAHPISSDIKISSDMLDAIGGKESPRYKTYLQLSAKGVIILRKFFNMFFILFSQLPEELIKEKEIQKFILKRFQPMRSQEMVVKELMTTIEQSQDTYSDYFRDLLHYHKQEKTMQNGIGRIIKNIKTITTG